MKSIGTLLREARIKSKLTLSNLEEKTKIKKSFLKALENEDWSHLPEFPVVIGFVKNVASFTGLNQEQIVAFLKRDYTLKKPPLSPKTTSIPREFHWNPKFTFILGILFAGIFVFSYLGFQYKRFTSPPKLNVLSPVENQTTSNTKILVSGKTTPGATIRVNDQPAIVDDEGIFQTEINLNKGENEIEIKAISRSGKETILKRKINVDF